MLHGPIRIGIYAAGETPKPSIHEICETAIQSRQSDPSNIGTTSRVRAPAKIEASSRPL
jgi:hypothetical protein